MDLSHGGPSWIGWEFRPGESNEWELFPPCFKTGLTPEKIVDNICRAREVATLRQKLEEQPNSFVVHLPRAERDLIHCALTILSRVIPTRRAIGTRKEPAPLRVVHNLGPMYRRKKKTLGAQNG